MVMAKMISEWEERIGDQSYHPFVTVDLGGDNWKVIPFLSFISRFSKTLQHQNSRIKNDCEKHNKMGLSFVSTKIIILHVLERNQINKIEQRKVPR